MLNALRFLRPGLLAGLSLSLSVVRAADAPAAGTIYQFDFGPGEGPEGFVQVPAGTAYNPERGYGFDFNSSVIGVERGESPRTDGFVTALEPPFFFSVRVPEGNYRITMTLGDAAGTSATTIRTEAAHLMAPAIETAPGAFEVRTFIAHVHQPELPLPPTHAPGESRVHMFLPGEAESRAWDGKLTIEFNGSSPCLAALVIEPVEDLPTIFVAGDSTVGDPRRGPGGNWPTQMCQHFKPVVAICNSGSGGETSKSFVTGQRMDKVLSAMKPGDFFLLQFGHNDSKPQWPQSYTEPGTTFDAYLRVLIAETRRRGATPVLVTPMERRANEDSVGPWARAMHEVAAREEVALIDQWTRSKELWTALGPAVGDAFSDQTHLSGYGGYLLARLVVGEMQANIPALARLLSHDFAPLDLADLPPPPDYLRQAAQ